MKTTKEISNFCNEFTFYDHYNFERVIELNYIRNYLINVISESEFKHDDNRIRVMSIIDDISLMVLDQDLKNIEHGKENEKRPNLVIDGKKLFRDDGIESFRNKKWFSFVNGILLYFLING